MKHFIFAMLVILLASPHAAYSQCTDSSTASEINLYLLKGAEARERLTLCRQYRQIDSAIIVQQDAALTAQNAEIRHERKRVVFFQITSAVLALLFIISL